MRVPAAIASGALANIVPMTKLRFVHRCSATQLGYAMREAAVVGGAFSA
jgi:hypothetical protein